ncbi:hypothetical protein EJV47_05180 [Hymenobacter gummosus]|uniref:SH3 domain-containing protein n=1 Tax=Hymenobacter gummosus TaxID=1776032 RepID=A0A431U6S1_9BACT|nr:hypothetical protein [Hymenobacter gummosus]RTQ52409.1 hypothetical protein EJV47_05180 [Hymenobacter gummosus]
MKTTVTSLLLLLLAGAAAAQKPQSARVYGVKDGHLVLLDSLRPGTTGWVPAPRAGRAAGTGQRRRSAPGSYRTESYALRVQVPAPHPDSVAVAAPGRTRDAMPRQQLPPVWPQTEGRRRGR